MTMTFEPDRIVASARDWVGTPWHHQGRTPRAGLDCVGLLVCLAHKHGLGVVDFREYDETPNPQTLLAYVGRSCFQVEQEEARAGDVLLFELIEGHGPQHAALLTGSGTIIHARRRRSLSMSRVKEQKLSRGWKNRLHSVWRYKEAG